MEAVTGLSRRTLIVLGSAVVLGIGASAVATLVSVEPPPGCSDARYGCATFRAGEPVVLGVLSARQDVLRAVRLVAELRGNRFAGRPLRVVGWNDRCTVEGAAEGARELATDAPDEPPVLAVIGETCPPAIIPAAQILSDSGVTLVSPSAPRLPSTAGEPGYYLGPGPIPPAPLQAFEAAYTQLHGPPAPRAAAAAFAADSILQLSRSLARSGRDGAVLVARTALRDGLLGAGFVRAA